MTLGLEFLFFFLSRSIKSNYQSWSTPYIVYIRIPMYVSVCSDTWSKIKKYRYVLNLKPTFSSVENSFQQSFKHT